MNIFYLFSECNNDILCYIFYGIFMISYYYERTSEEKDNNIIHKGVGHYIKT